MTRRAGRHAAWRAPLLAAALALLLLGAAGPEGSQGEEAPAAAPRAAQRSRFYGSMGLGFLSLPRGVGVDVPFDFTAAIDPLHLVLSGTVLDLGLLQGGNRDLRYYRPYMGYSYCVDSRGYQVPDYYCSGGTDALLSAQAEAAYVLVDEVRVSDQPGRVYLGVGRRFAKPRTFYATAGMLFDRSPSRLGRVRLAVGRDYVSLGFAWGLHLFGF